MSAIGFGSKVTGAGSNPRIIAVTNGNDGGDGSLAKALEMAKQQQDGTTGTEIRIHSNIAANTADLMVQAQNLTIRGGDSSLSINKNHLIIDCTQADNVILCDLRFTSDGVGQPTDTISIAAREGRGRIGIWIDHCYFEAYKDLSITSNTKDLDGTPPLRMTISNCHFYDSNPNGTANRDHGALGVHGTGRKKSGTRNRTEQEDLKTNAYATICRNYFANIRRRSPRSSNKTFVHAFNNVLENWGTDGAVTPLDQENGMEAGHFGILAAEANYFKAGVLKESIKLATEEQPVLFVGKDGLVNVYKNGAIPAVDAGNPNAGIVAKKYTAGNRPAPSPEVMTQELRSAIKDEAGPRPGRLELP